MTHQCWTAGCEDPATVRTELRHEDGGPLVFEAKTRCTEHAMQLARWWRSVGELHTARLPIDIHRRIPGGAG